jgi:predicted AAA+ superfamily ATPase
MLRVLIDKNRDTQKYLILGSASRELIKQSSETLAGRISYLELTPFQLTEAENVENLWLRGGFPRSFLATEEEASFLWREAYIRTFLEQDIPDSPSGDGGLAILPCPNFKNTSANGPPTHKASA